MNATLGLLLILASQTPPIRPPRALEVEVRPAGDPQIAIWLEDKSGQHVDTLMITRLTGTFGLGNRAGRADFGGGFLWPYGKREMVLPVWAHTRGVEYDRLVFQDCKESWLGWHESTSSSEPFYCRPVTSAEMSVDTITCPTSQFNTDKGIPLRLISPDQSSDCATIKATLPPYSFYPPRNDLGVRDPTRDWSGVLDLKNVNDLDAVSRATPPANTPLRVTSILPAALADGEYVVWVEVNQEYDANASHSYDFFRDPALTDYGIPHVGQPSLLWRVPITVSATSASAYALDYAGYGSPDGLDGNIRPPDQTISQNVPGSGIHRLLVNRDGGTENRVRVRYSAETSCAPPLGVAAVTFKGSDWGYAEVAFTPDPEADERVASYELRYAEGRGAIPNLEAFMRAVPGPTMRTGQPGETQVVRIEQLRPETTYTVALRSFNFCGEPSELTTVEVTTATRVFATVDACFIATAAYGSVDADDVVTLRQFRDAYLITHAPGRKLVDLYYWASPPLADLIRERAWARSATMKLLSPLVWIAESLE